MKIKRELTDKQKKRFAIAAFIIMLLVCALICVIIGGPMLRFAKSPDKFRQWVSQYGIWGGLAYMGMVFLQVVIAIIPGEPIEIAGGYAFGAVGGTVLYLVASALGSIVSFLLVRRYGVRFVEIFFPRDKIEKLTFLKISPKRRILFLLIFMTPGTPKDLLCYFAGLTDIKFGSMLLICTFGRLPALVTSTIGGSALGEKSYLFAVIVFAAAFILSVGGLWIYNRICNTKKKAHRG
ncbi:MAG: TVP38/TMEM64 family protein [Oscillospiraceae bacterium]|nr:TVP38/TMEM64 family protein [Oscillospiraceae bacterium]